MELLEDNTGAANLPPDWKNANCEGRTLAMHAARNGLARCLRYLMEERNVDIFATDSQSRNALHHAALGGSIVVNSYTVEICRTIFDAQPSMLQEKSSEGLYPLMILCKAGGGTVITRKQSAYLSEVAKNAKKLIALMLEMDVFGDCLNQTAPNGWSPLHFAAASGNHELVTHLCNVGFVNVNQAVKETGFTALHIAAQENHVLCVRALLLEDVNIVAKDSNGWIPMLYAQEATVIQEFMHYKLTKQLSRLHRMLSKYQQRGLVRQWQRRVARDPSCFDILNDWCQCDPERIERMEGLLLSNPFLLRLDNKLEYVWRCIGASIKKSPGQGVIGVESETPRTDKHLTTQKKLAIVFHVKVGVFGDTGLLKEMPGLLMRGHSVDLESNPNSLDKQKLDAQLLGYYLLGELVAHFVLYAVPISGILDFAPAFLRCIGCKGKYTFTSDKPWEIAGRSFAAGFEAVLPATLELFHADGLRVLFNGPEMSLNIRQIDWNTTVDWDIRGSETMAGEDIETAKMWMPRLMNELVEEEQQLFLLFMTGTFQLANEGFFRSEGESARITIASHLDSGNAVDSDTMYPTMEHKPDILRLPSYSCYEAFKKAMLTVIRHVDQAFLPE
ncbi:hypothetical protein ON010_g6853 [Phytophthora cinnamomi]|nr:hypothetical protein ON010_g6853 [Phytophthora cinnamomi]